MLCAYFEAPDAVVLIDPLVPRDEEDEFWRALDEEHNQEAFLASLTELLALPIERVLIAHGKPVLNDGVARIREALESA